MNFFWRKPAFPVLVDTGTELIVLRTAAEGDRLLSGLPKDGTPNLDVIDAKVEGFCYVPQHHTISPLTMKKSWTKAEIIALYNARKPADAPPYAPTLATRRLPQVFADVVDLLRPRRGSSAPRRG
jgi:hypothetical protein